MNYGLRHEWNRLARRMRWKETNCISYFHYTILTPANHLSNCYGNKIQHFSFFGRERNWNRISYGHSWPGHTDEIWKFQRRLRKISPDHLPRYKRSAMCHFFSTEFNLIFAAFRFHMKAIYELFISFVAAGKRNFMYSHIAIWKQNKNNSRMINMQWTFFDVRNEMTAYYLLLLFEPFLWGFNLCEASD